MNKTKTLEVQRVIEFGNIKIDLKKLFIFKDDQRLKINNTEKLILEKMINSPGKIYKRDEIASLIDLNIERSIDDNFKIRIFDNIQFSENDSVENITLELNKILEKMIIANPKQWIWTHNRWKL